MIAIVVGVFLLAIKYEKPLNQGSYRKIRLFLALGTLLDAIICLVAGYCSTKGLNTLVLDQHFVPIIFNLQLSIMSYAMMGLLHIHHINRFTPWMYDISAAIATVTFFVSYLIWSGGEFSWERYEAFTFNSQFAFWFRTIYVTYLVLALVRTCVHLVRASHRYVHIVENYFSEEEVISGRRLSVSVYVFVGYFVFSALVFLIPNIYADQVVDLIISCFLSRKRASEIL